MPTTSPITLGPTAFLSLRTVAQGSIAAVDFNHQFASLASTATDAEVRFGNTSTLTVGDASSTTYAGIFTQSTSTGTPSLVKTGTGSFTLAGNSAADPAVGVLAVAFSGTVTVNQGRLIVTTAPGVTGVFNNSGTGRATVTVSTGGTLAGTGAIVPDKGSQASNTITIATGGTVDPGTTAGTIGNLFIGAATAKSNVTINGTYRVDLTTVSSDQLTIIGSLALGANSILDASGITSTPGGPTTLQFTIATFDAGSLSGTFNLGSSVIPAGSSIQYNSNSIVLFVPVPEPGSVLALTAGAMAGLAALRRHFVSRV